MARKLSIYDMHLRKIDWNEWKWLLNGTEADCRIIHHHYIVVNQWFLSVGSSVCILGGTSVVNMIHKGHAQTLYYGFIHSVIEHR